jgi:hypothetical protein
VIVSALPSIEEVDVLKGDLGLVWKTLVDLEWIIRFGGPDIPYTGNIVEVCWADIILISNVVWDQSAFSGLEADVIEQLKGPATCEQLQRQQSLGRLTSS